MAAQYLLIKSVYHDSLPYPEGKALFSDSSQGTASASGPGSAFLSGSKAPSGLKLGWKSSCFRTALYSITTRGYYSKEYQHQQKSFLSEPRVPLCNRRRHHVFPQAHRSSPQSPATVGTWTPSQQSVEEFCSLVWF